MCHVFVASRALAFELFLRDIAMELPAMSQAPTIACVLLFAIQNDGDRRLAYLMLLRIATKQLDILHAKLQPNKRCDFRKRIIRIRAGVVVDCEVVQETGRFV